ncbi:MAG: DMT family transporter [Candidatus Koribacter versatilis]|uniref:DMT family transporter n=1 Tax=Candidatus Korobacter versatilis TaxID=658062 RepID=A0A932A6S6_9BACT|nr:DMT family transporter [Candidatus Koribacter versatilis]
MSRALKAHVLLVLNTLVWGVTFVVIKDALADISPLYFNAVRMTLAAACLAAVYRRCLLRVDRATWLSGALLGLFLWGGYEFQTTGLVLTTPSKSAFLTGLSVILVPVFLSLIWRRKVNHWTITGVLAAFAGLYLLTVPAGDTMFDISSVNRGDLLTIGCAIAFAFHIIFLGRATKKHAFEQMAVLQTAFAALLMWFTVPVLEHAHALWSPRVVWAILVTGVLCTAVAFSIQAWAQQFTPPTHTALIFALEPVFAWLTSYVVLHERLGARAALGAGLILGGILLSELLGRVVEAAPGALAPAELEEEGS